MKSQIFLSSCLIFLIALVGCRETTTSTTEVKSTPSTTATSPRPVIPQTVKASPKPSKTTSNPSSTPVAENQIISAQGIGSAKVGMTFGQLKKVLGQAKFSVISPFIVDLDAIAVNQSGKVQYYILYPAGTTFKDTDVIENLMTENIDYKTDKGVGPGTPLKQAEAIYGEAKLSYNLASEGREYVSFANQPAKNIYFRMGAYGDGSLAGNYQSNKGEYNETKEYRQNATIKLIEVSCLANSCSKK